jgi:hypothetical protein
MISCLLSHLASKLTAKCNVFTIIHTKNHVSRVYDVVNLPWLQFMVHVMLLPFINVLNLYIGTFQNICPVSNMAVFCSSFISCLLLLLLLLVVVVDVVVVVVVVVVAVVVVVVIIIFHVSMVALVQLFS